MSIEIGSKWVKDWEVVEIVWLNETCVCEYELSGNEKMVWYEFLSDTKKWRDRHVLTESDFLDQYKPYEPVYEYQYAYPMIKNNHEIIIVQNVYLTDEQMEKSGIKEYQRLDFTKRERK